MLLVPRRKPRRIRGGNQREFIQIKSYIEGSKDKHFFIKHRSAGSTQIKWYLLQVDMVQSYPVNIRDYGVYRCWWYIRHLEDFTKRPIIKCCFWPEIREMHQDGTLGRMQPVIPLQVNDLFKERQGCVWYQDDISLAEDRLVGPFQIGTTVRNKLKYPSTIDNK